MFNYAVILMAVFCILFYTGQTFMNKLYSTYYDGPAETASPVFSCIYGILVSTITLALHKGRVTPSFLTIFMGVLNGGILFLYNLGMIKAARRGPYTFQSIVMLFGSIVVCLVFSALFWGDHITALQLFGILVMLISFIALNSGGLKRIEIRKGYYFWLTLLFFTNGFYGVLMDSQQRLYPDERNEMIVFTFASLALISMIYLGFKERSRFFKAYRMPKPAVIYAFLSSVCAAFAVFFLMILLKYVPSYILYTVNNGSILVLSALLSAIILKEKITKSTIVGILLAVTSIVMLSV